MTGRPARTLATIQGVYFALTGLWPIFHIESFMAVTGPKTDLWLVRTVGWLVTAIAIPLLISAWRGSIHVDVIILAIGAALALAGIDIYYAANNVIWDIYLMDAVAELLLVAGWVAIWAFATPRAAKAPRHRAP